MSPALRRHFSYAIPLRRTHCVSTLKFIEISWGLSLIAARIRDNLSNPPSPWNVFPLVRLVRIALYCKRQQLTRISPCYHI